VGSGECGKANASRIDDEGLTNPDDTRDVRVAAEHELCANSAGTLQKLGSRDETDPPIVYSFQHVHFVVRWRAVEGKDRIRDGRSGRKRSKPLYLLWTKPFECEAIGLAVIIGRLLHELPIAVCCIRNAIVSCGQSGPDA